ncbi:MafI family immunity protein [Luteimicrobium sp. DT211]|uniref:MafI family immunity protein n=1 Tax=Luteimicrobium sp. DT211 TaxID=3393412 RepID=UPI003CE8E3CE
MSRPSEGVSAALESQLFSLGHAFVGRVTASTMDQFLEFVHAGEYGVALEYLCDHLEDAEVR